MVISVKALLGKDPGDFSLDMVGVKLTVCRRLLTSKV